MSTAPVRIFFEVVMNQLQEVNHPSRPLLRFTGCRFCPLHAPPTFQPLAASQKSTALPSDSPMRPRVRRPPPPPAKSSVPLHTPHLCRGRLVRLYSRVPRSAWQNFPEIREDACQLQYALPTHLGAQVAATLRADNKLGPRSRVISFQSATV